MEASLVGPDAAGGSTWKNPVAIAPEAFAGMLNAMQLACETFDFVPDPVVALDVHGKVIAWNRAMEALTGVAARAILHKGDYACGIPFYGYRRPILGSLFLSPDASVESKYTVLRKEAQDSWVGEAEIAGRRTVWAKASPLRGPEGELVGVVEIVKDITEDKRIQQQLDETRVALKVLLEQRERDRADFQADVVANVQRLVLPGVARLRARRLTPEQAACLDLIEADLQAIVSPFLRNVGLRHRNLTRREVEIAQLVRQGRSSKQIAQLLSLSPRSVDFHRANLRRKLGARATRENLGSVLRALSD
jgi:DNA-binding CsgD family transcriptional regulator